jgi:hypothetical protein
MKKVSLILLVTIAVLVCSFQFAAQSIWDQLGIDESYAQRTIVGNLVNNAVKIPYAKLLSTVVQGDKIAATKELEQYLKEYTQSEAFKKDYEAYRISLKPTYEPQPLSQETIDGLKESYAQTMEIMNNTELLKMFPKDALEQYKKSMEDMKLQIEQAQDPTPNKTKWEKEYPEDPKSLIKNKLQEFLAVSSSVDFNAEITTNKYNKKIFVNPEYEKKSSEWKACFRAGKEVNAEARIFVQKWLKEL